jgi:F-type H+-transporting ATPase subunit b
VKRLLLVALLALPAVAEEHGSGHGEPAAVWKWANFGILAAAIGYAVAKNAPGFFRNRTAEIQKSIVEARRLREEAEARAAEIERKLANIGAEIESMRAQARQEMESEGQRFEQETARLVARVEEHARQEIESLTKHAENELQAYAAELTLKLARQKVEARLSPETQTVLLSRFLGTLPSAPGTNN